MALTLKVDPAEPHYGEANAGATARTPAPLTFAVWRRCFNKN